MIHHPLTLRLEVGDFSFTLAYIIKNISNNISQEYGIETNPGNPGKSTIGNPLDRQQIRLSLHQQEGEEEFEESRRLLDYLWNNDINCDLSKNIFFKIDKNNHRVPYNALSHYIRNNLYRLFKKKNKHPDLEIFTDYISGSRFTNDNTFEYHSDNDAIKYYNNDNNPNIDVDWYRLVGMRPSIRNHTDKIRR